MEKEGLHEDFASFESRKADHVRLSLEEPHQAVGASGLLRVRLIHEALPELNWNEINIETSFFGEKVGSPIFISAMTAGHSKSARINATLAEAANTKGWVMGVGSQRKQLFESEAATEWKLIRKKFPKMKIMGNIGLSQLIETSNEIIQELVDSLGASAMVVHLNALQEVLQLEGTPNFRGGLKRLEDLAKVLQVPLVLKETGCGFSKRTLLRLKGLGIRAVDVSGLGGTHWGRIEGARHHDQHMKAQAAQVFRDWGNSTVDSLRAAMDVKPDYDIWGSGGVRSGLDVAKVIGLGARMVGMAQPFMVAALQSVGTTMQLMEKVEFELRLAMFCTGSRSLQELRNHIEIKEELRP